MSDPKRDLFNLEMGDETVVIRYVCSQPRKSSRPPKRAAEIAVASWAPDGRGVIVHQFETWLRETAAARGRGFTVGEGVSRRCPACGADHRFAIDRIRADIQRCGHKGLVVDIDLYESPIESE